MTRLLSELLGAGEPMFSLAMRQLENASGNRGVDVRITADIIARLHASTKAMGLDPHDTTAKELYHGLVSMARLHDQFLARRIGGTDTDDVAHMLERMRIAAENVHVPREAWVVKHSVIKRLLKSYPPKAAQKALGYRSLDSMLKREPVPLIMAAVRVTESDKWHHTFLQKYTALQPVDFEIRTIEVLRPDADRWSRIADHSVRARHHNITHLKELGAIVILPLPIKRLPGITLAVFPLILHYINEIRLYSSFFKLQQVQPNFGAIVSQTLLHDPGEHVSVGGRALHWRIVQRHFGRHAAVLPEMFEPHVRLEDLEWRKAEEVLYELEPALHFWHDLEYVGFSCQGGPVSFNIMDNAANFVNSLPFERRAYGRMRQALWNEISQRYIANPMLERHVLRQLDTASSDPGLLALSLRT